VAEPRYCCTRAEADRLVAEGKPVIVDGKEVWIVCCPAEESCG